MYLLPRHQTKAPYPPLFTSTPRTTPSNPIPRHPATPPPIPSVPYPPPHLPPPVHFLPRLANLTCPTNPSSRRPNTDSAGGGRRHSPHPELGAALFSLPAKRAGRISGYSVGSRSGALRAGEEGEGDRPVRLRGEGDGSDCRAAGLRRVR